MTMKLENYETYKADISADSFTFPHNSNSYVLDPQKFLDTKSPPYTLALFGTKIPWKNTMVIALSGHFDGSTKNSDYRNLKRRINDREIKKFYFGSDRFAICLGTKCQSTFTGSRVNFIDYQASFISPFGLLFGDTQKTGGSSGTAENEGDVFTPIEQITGSVTASDEVTITDKDENGFKFTATDTGTFNLYLIYNRNIGNGNRFTEYYYGEIGGVKQTLQQVNKAQDIFIGLEPAEDLATRFSGATITNITPTFKFRDGHSAD
jgi:hypothetical protein